MLIEAGHQDSIRLSSLGGGLSRASFAGIPQQFGLQPPSIEMAAQPGRDRLHIPQGVAQAAGAPRRGGHIEGQARHGGNTRLPQHQAFLALVNQLGPHAPEAFGEPQVLQPQAGHNFAGIGQE